MVRWMRQKKLQQKLVMNQTGNPFAEFETKKQDVPLSSPSQINQTNNISKENPFAEFEQKKGQKEPSKYGKVIGSAAISGALDIPSGFEEFLIRKPSKYLAKEFKKLGVPISEEFENKLSETTLPTTEILYKNGFLTPPSTTGEKYASAATKGGVGGAILGSRFGPYGALIGGVGGAVISLGVQGARDLGIPEEWIDAAEYALGVSGLAAKKFAGPTKKKTAASLVRIAETAGDEPPPPGTPTIQERSLEHLQKPVIQSEQGRNIPQPGQIPQQGGASLAGRVTRDVSVIPISPTSNITDIVSPNQFRNSAEGGHALNELVVNRFNQRSEISRANFEQAAQDTAPYEFNPSDTDTLRQLVQRTRTELEQSASPSRPERAVLARLNEIEHLIGAPGSLQGGPAQRLISTSNSIGQSLNHDLDYVGAENLLRPIAHELNIAARSSVQRNGGRIDRINHADQYYSNLSDTFQNKDIKPYLNELVSNPESLYNMAVENPGKFRSLWTALHDIPEGQRAMRIVSNALVNDRFKDYIKNPSKIGDQDFNKLMREMSGLIGEEATHQAQQRFQSMKLSDQRLQQLTPRTREVHASAKYLDMSIEKFESKLKTVSGIREISRDMGRTENGRQLRSQLWREETVKMFKDGKSHPKQIKASRAAEILNEETNFKIISEFIGEDAAKRELENLKSLGDKEINRETAAKYLKNGILIKTFKTLLF